MWTNPWTNVYGVARTLLAIGTLLTLLFHRADTLFRPLGAVNDLVAHPLAKYSLFSMFPGNLELSRWIAVVILLLVISGWRPGVTGLLHWWVSFSYTTSAHVIEGGDQIATIITLLLIPVTLTDPRKWHWSGPGVDASMRRVTYALTAGSAWMAIRLQVAFVYFHASVGKFAVAEWTNGTAAYYWFLHPLFGAADWLRPFLHPFLTSNAVMLFTWGAIAVEILLTMALFMDKKYRRYLLVLGLCFHLAIAVVHGLVSFFFAMAGALVLYLRAPEHPFSFWSSNMVLPFRTGAKPLPSASDSVPATPAMTL